jgi:V8-like Glu-specific endopeptidase
LAAKFAPIIDGTAESGRENVVILINRGSGGLCTGAIVSERSVLTAKHCVQAPGAAAPILPNQLTIGIGDRIFGGNMRFVGVADIVATPGTYTDGAFGVQDLVGDDVAVVTLLAPPGVTPLKIKLGDPSDEEGKRATAVGFGQTPRGETGIKYTVETTIRDVSAETIQVDGTVCQGDSGGPLINANGETYGVVSFGTAQNCGGGASFYQRIDTWSDLIRDAIERAGDCSGDGVESCDGFDNDCDDEIDEDCAQLGEACSDDMDCATLLCADSPEGRVCVSPCDPLSPDTGCDAGYFCASTEDCQGVCIKGKVGEKGFGEPCEQGAECASLFCADPGDGNKRCLVTCRGDESNCFSGEACIAQGGQCGSCVDADLVSGKLGADEPCNDDGGCRSGICFDDGGTKYCATSCGGDDDCDGKHHCRDEVCVRGSRQGLGGSCQEHGDCAKGFFCIETGKGEFCTRACGEDEPCGEGFSCEPASNGQLCLPEKSVVGGACEGDDDCASGLCHAPSGTCTRLCADATACGPGLECVRTGTDGGRCLSPEAAKADPLVSGEGAGADGKGKGKGDSGCSALPGAGRSASAVWLLVSLAALLQRRRRAA